MSAFPQSSRYQPRAGMGMPLTSIRLGETIAAAPARKWKHPWFTQPAWSPEAAQWTATVLPGFVNEQAPVYRATVAEQKAAGNPWEINPLTGKKFFSDPVFGGQPGAVAAQIVDMPLYLNPAIALDFRGLGFDGDPSFPVPQFFLNMGAAKTPVEGTALSVLDGGSDGALPSSPTPPAGLRLLRACDLWIHQPRLGLTSDVEIRGDIALGTGNVVQTLGVNTPAPSDTLQILSGTYVPFDPGTAGIDPLSNDYTEPTFDELLISTVFLLSAPNAPLGSQPDASWQPFVRHNLFWNLNWAQPFFTAGTIDPNVGFIPPLAAGAATLVINTLVASLNDATQNALNQLQASSLAGSFWTATGGGSSAQFTVPSAQTSPKTGPDRSKNAAAKIAALQTQRRQTQLDPDFPYNAQPFPTTFLAA